MKSKFGSIWKVTLALVLICSLAMTFAVPTGATEQSLVVTIESPEPGDQFEVSDTFNVVATVHNSGDETVYGIDAVISWDPDGDAELVGGDSYTKALGDISPGSTQDAQWTLHCTGPSHPLTITVTATGGASDSVDVQQLGEPGIQIVIDSPLDDPPMKVGVEDQFDVVATVTNTGLEPLCGVDAWLNLSGANAFVVTYPSIPSTLEKDEDVTLTWTLECDGADPIDDNGGTPSDPRDDTVDYSAIVAWADGYGCSTSGYVDDFDETSVYQKPLMVEITAPEDGWRTNECREFYVNATITNRYNKDIQAGGTATIYWTDGGDVEIYAPPTASQSLPAIGVGETVSVPFPWHLHCLAEGDVTIDVVAVVIATDAITHLNWDTITIHQDTPAALEASSSDPVCYGVSNTFEITSDITNTGGEASVDTTATITWSPSSDVTLLSPNATVDIGTLAGGATEPVTWEFHCTAPGTVNFTITPAGYGANTGELIDDANPGYSDPIPGHATVYQMPLLVTITAPLEEPTYSECQTFSVEADLYNPGGMGDLGPVDATIILTGPAELVQGETETKTIGSVNECDTQHVAWTVHCDGSGDVIIAVKGSTVWMVTEQEQYTISEPVTVHQEFATDIEVTILSPDPEERVETAVATSQDFAVTALVENLGEADSLNTTVTINPGANASVVPLPNATIDLDTLAGYSSETVTWTLHCDESGDTEISVTAVGTDENSNDTKCDTEYTYVYQYPAAHLEIDITEIVPVGETEPSYTFPVSTEFDVYYTVTNTGEADAWEVMATLSATPDGSVRPVAGEDSGYTQEIGTLAGHGQDGTYEGIWRLHCKEACESTITITAEGYDEYGWHMKQLVLYKTHAHAEFDGYYFGGFEGGYSGTYSGGFNGDFNGDYSGDFNGDYSGGFEGDYSGDFKGSITNGAISGGFSGSITNGVIETDFVDAHFDGTFDNAKITGTVCPDDCNCYSLDNGTLTGPFSGTITGSIDGNFTGDFSGTFDDVKFSGDLDGSFVNGEFSASIVDGEFHGSFANGKFNGIFNGNFNGSFEGSFGGMFGGCFCGTFDLFSIQWPIHYYKLHMLPGEPIPERFIEPDSVTVKQVETPTQADLDVTKVADDDTFTVGEEVTFTIAVQNLGEVDATGVRVTDLLQVGLSYVSSDPDQGWYDVTSGIWHIGDLAVGYSVELDITATVNMDGYISNIADITACDQPDSTTTNNSAMVMITGEAAPPPEPYEEWTITVDEGYNLISLPLIPENPAINTMTASLTELEKIRRYVPGATPPADWPVYNAPPASYPGLSTLFTMEDGYGYWVKMQDPGSGGSFTFDGWELVAETDPPSVPPSYDVVEGWNLIGFKSTTPKLASDYLAGIAGKYAMIYGYDGSFFIVGTPGHEYLEPGFGYWLAMKTGESGTIYP